MFINNVHCKHILFGCCHDNGYVPMLNSWKNNQKVSPRISLLQPYRLGKEYEGLSFRIAKFQNVFRDTELPPNNNPKSPGLNSAQLQRRMSAGNNGHMRRPSTPGAGPAPVAEMQPQQVIPPVAHGVVRPRTLAAEPCSEKIAPLKIIKNRHGERLDRDLPKANADHHQLFRQRFLNNSQQPCHSRILGTPCYTLDCKYNHDDLSLGELLVLKMRARSLPCAQGSACFDPSCIYGHTCPHDPYCRFGHDCKLVMFHGKDKETCPDVQEDSERAKRQKFSHNY